MKNNQSEQLEHAKIECNFNLAMALSQNTRLHYAFTPPLTLQQYEFMISEKKLRYSIEIAKEKSKNT
jgi:hypothetical protein